MMEIYKREVVFPSKFVCKASDVPNIAKFEVSPIQRGFGTTIGNTLRRVLLSSIGGYALSNLKIAGVSHEFSTVSNVVEDVPEIIYNLKRVVFSSNKNATLKISESGPKKVFARDIKVPNGVNVINGDILLFEISGRERVDIEMELTSGVYSKYADPSLSIDSINLDVNFNPIKNVSFYVSDTRVGSKVDYDKLSLEIETNGSITPKDAFIQANTILISMLSSFSRVTECDLVDNLDTKVSNFAGEFGNKNQDSFNYSVVMEISELDLIPRVQNCLTSEGIRYVGELLTKTENDLKVIPNFGATSLKSLMKELDKMNLSLGSVAEWPIEDFERRRDEYKKIKRNGSNNI